MGLNSQMEAHSWWRIKFSQMPGDKRVIVSVTFIKIQLSKQFIVLNMVR